MTRSLLLLTTLALAASPLAARAEADDGASLYDLKIEAAPKLKKGAQGHLLVRISPKKGAELHKEAPIALAVKPSANVTVAKAKYTRDDMKLDGDAATYDVPFTASAAGPGTLDTTLTFFICTEKLCLRQERKTSLPLAIE